MCSYKCLFWKGELKLNYEYLTNRFNDDAIGIVVIYDDTDYGVISLNKKMRNFLIRKRIETT